MRRGWVQVLEGMPCPHGGTGSCAGRNGLLCWARVPVGMGSSAQARVPAGLGSFADRALLPAGHGRHGLECRPARAHVPAGTVRLVCRRHGLVCRQPGLRALVRVQVRSCALAGIMCQFCQKFLRSMARTCSPVAGRHGLMCRPA